MLHLDKLIEASSVFRASPSGRFVLDVVRPVLQTADAVGAPLQECVLHIVQNPPEHIAAAPEQFT
jgi:hypothetical protein